MTIDLNLSELRAKAEAAKKVAPGEWEADRERMTDAPDKHHEFFVIDGPGDRMFGTENADAAFGVIEIEDDGDGFVVAWNENSRRVIEFVVAAQPRAILALIERVEKAEALSDLLEGSQEENSHLRALLARAGEALEPFAELALDLPPVWGDDRKVRVGIPLGNSRTARTIAREIEEAIGHE